MNKTATPLLSGLSRRVGLLITTFGMLLGSQQVQAQYCTNSTATSCTTDHINNFSTTNGCTNILNLGTGCSGTSSYNNYTATQTHTTQKGTFVFFSATFGGGTASPLKFLRIWVDYNGDFDFIDAGEQVYTSTGFGPGVAVNGSFQVPNTAAVVPGTTRMRIRVSPTAATTPCNNIASGETEDYAFVIVPVTACAGAPSGGSAQANNNNVCYNTGTTLTLTGSTCAPGISYQWQYLDGATWVNATGASTNPTYNTGNLTSTRQYRARLTCGALTGDSNPVTVSVAVQSPPYLETFEGITAANTLPSCMAATNLGTNVQTFTSNQASYNRINYTPGGSKFASFRNTATSSFIYTPALALIAGQQYQLSFWYISDGLAGWNTFQAYFGETANPAGMVNLIGSIAGGPQALPPVSNTTYQQFIGTFTPTTTDTFFIGLYSQQATTPNQYLTIDDINLVELPPCSGAPAAGTPYPAGPINICTGLTAQLSVTGSTAASNIAYQWQASPNGVSGFVDVIGGVGYNTLNFTTPPNYVTTFYRLKLTCTNTNDSSFTVPVEVNVASATYAPLPVTETFENWINRCNTTDVPGTSWATVPAIGNSSWRRDDQGASANWSSPSAGANFPASAEGAHSARFHSTYASPAASRGNLDLLVNCAGAAGDIELQFYYMNVSGIDSLKILVSTDGGGNFTEVGGFGQAPLWDYQSLTFTSVSPQTIIRFQGKSDAIPGGTDIGIDAVQVLPPCAGTPNPGTITTFSPCPGETFGLSLTGGAPAAGLAYEWQSTTDTLLGPWTPVPNGNEPILSTAISDTTYFRVVVTCLNNGATATTPIRWIPLAWFYYCYCTSNATVSSGSDIGNFTVRTVPGGYPLLSNGTATPLVNNPNANNTYTNFNYLNPVITYLDSSLRFIVTQINSNTFQASTAAVFVDMDHNGVFDLTEKVFEETTSNSSTPPQQVFDTFTVPSNALLGITGLRAVLIQGNGPVDPCGPYTNGETEDYLIEVQYHPCEGPANPGIALISDTTGCVGYNIVITDTTHERELSNIEWIWEYSPDGNSWADLPGSFKKDEIQYLVTGNTYFRLKMTCYKPTAIDVTYSNVVSITIASPYACYCYSIANGENFDSSDNSLFKIGDYEISQVGPHVLNPTSVNGRTDYTDQSNFELWADTTYTVEVYHTLRSPSHGDAKVTLFMDFNNDFLYDADERVWTSYSTASNFYVSTQLTIPSNAITGLKTGMRLVLNNNTGPNIPSDEGCGVYTSGETEDFVVTFRNALLNVTPASTRLSGVDIYPNPGKGRFNLDLHGSQALGEALITVKNVTGQTIATYDYRNLGVNFSTEIDLTGQAKGIYFVEISAAGEKTVRKVIIQ